ncbi:MAG: hypothetical protein IJW24_03490 [Clostridia bacterium]|nr:hypothetical protein [Clostridia bacterium]
MKRENLKKADFAEYNKLGCESRAVARVRGEENYVIVENPERGVYNILADDVTELTEISEYMTMLYKKTDGRFGILFANGANVVLTACDDIRCAGHLKTEMFIIRRDNKEYVVKIFANGNLRRYAGPFAEVRPFDKRRKMIVREMSNGEHSVIALDNTFKRVSGWFKEIGEANDEGMRIAVFGNHSFILDDNFHGANETVNKVFFERGTDGVIKAPTAIMPVRNSKGMVGFVDGTKSGAPRISNFVFGDKITAPRESGLVTISRTIGKSEDVKHISLLKADDENYLIDQVVNVVEDPEFFDGVMKSLEKSRGESIFKMDRKYFMNKSTLSDIKVAYRKFFDNRIDSMKEIILSGRSFDELREDQVEYVEFLLDGFRKELRGNFNDCVSAKTSGSEAETFGSHVLDDLTIDEILYDPMEEIYEELKAGR